MTRRSIDGPLTAHPLGDTLWLSTSEARDAVDVYLRIATPQAAAALRRATLVRVELDWRPGGSIGVVCVDAQGLSRLEATSAIVHERQGHVYDALPLAAFDSKAQRFWQRVFWVIRIPGGRWLLKILTRRNR